MSYVLRSVQTAVAAEHMIADEAALMKERKVIEGHLNANQRKLDDLKKRMAT